MKASHNEGLQLRAPFGAAPGYRTLRRLMLAGARTGAAAEPRCWANTRRAGTPASPPGEAGPPTHHLQHLRHIDPSRRWSIPARHPRPHCSLRSEASRGLPLPTQQGLHRWSASVTTAGSISSMPPSLRQRGVASASSAPETRCTMRHHAVYALHDASEGVAQRGVAADGAFRRRPWLPNPAAPHARWRSHRRRS
jgi:hypothetical protein